MTRIAFRFCVIYFGLFCLLFTQIMFAFTGILGQWLPDRAILWQMEVLAPALEWVGRHVFGVDAVLHLDSGSGDQTVIWVMVFCFLVIAAVATLIWSVLDRRRTGYPKLSAWFFTFIRLCLAGQMLFYGIAKAIP
ncbi:DoxX family protein, partial [Nocardia cyriacigeorgica]|nr:DoxX family protein [Nocardia cyriacigeorgica]